MNNSVLVISLLVISGCSGVTPSTEAPTPSAPSPYLSAKSIPTPEIEATEEVVPMPTETNFPTETSNG